MTRPTLRNPPIREALIDIQFDAPLDLAKVAVAADSFSENYPKRQTLRHGVFELSMGQESDLTARTRESATIGYRLDNEDGSRVVQFRDRGITFSILKGYSTWDAFKQEARSVWERWNSIVGETHIVRVATRFINVLQLPASPIDFDDFLTCAPRVPSELPQVLAGFFQQITIPVAETGFAAIVTHALEPGTPSATPVVLDIDVFQAKYYSSTDESVWAALDTAREIKNRVFFSSLTNKALELFK